MLNEVICKKCKQKFYKDHLRDVPFSHLSSGHSWYCPLLSRVVSKEGLPPENCHYDLEHVVSKHES